MNVKFEHSEMVTLLREWGYCVDYVRPKDFIENGFGVIHAEVAYKVESVPHMIQNSINTWKGELEHIFGINVVFERELKSRLIKLLLKT